MSYKRKILTIITLVVLLLLTMSTTIQAASVGKVYNLEASMNGNQIKLTWSSVSGAEGYNVYANGTKVGSINTNEASLIGFSEDTTYRFKVAAYDYQGREGTISSEAELTTTLQETLGKVTDLKVTQVNGYVTLNWSSVNKANKYQIFVDIPNFGETSIGEVTTNNVTIKGFTDNLRYGFSVRACQTLSNGKMNVGEKATYQYCTVDYDRDDTDYNDNNYDPQIGTVINVNTYDITDTEATVSWSAVSGADGYEVRLSKNYGSYKTVKDTTKTNCYLSNLTPDSYYRVKVVAYEDINGRRYYGEESSYDYFTTKESQDTNVDEVTSVSISNITNNSAYASWSKVSNATGYNIYVSKDYGTSKYLTSTTATNYTLQNLDSNTYYKVTIEGYRIVNGKEYTGDSYTKGFTTSKVNVNQVKGVSVSNIVSTEASVSWSKVSDADGYEVRLSKNYGSYKTILDTVRTQCCLYELTPDSYYRVKVVAYEYINGEKYYGQESDYKDFTTGELQDTNVGEVRSLSVSEITQNSAYASWSKNGSVTGYDIYVSKDYGEFQYKGMTTSTNYKLNNLEPNTYYQIKVVSYRTVDNIQYVGEESVKGFTTLKKATNNDGRLATVEHLTVEVRNINEAYLIWWAVEDADGYEVYTSRNNETYRYQQSVEGTSNAIIKSEYLDYSTNYSVKVRAYKYDRYGNKIYGNYCKSRGFNTGKYDKKQNSQRVETPTPISAPVTETTVNLSWTEVSGAEGYEIDFYVPGIGYTKLRSDKNSREVGGVTKSPCPYSARIRAYKKIDGTTYYSPYSDRIKFQSK